MKNYQEEDINIIGKIMIPATIPYVGAVALAKAVGVSTAGLSAIELSNAIAQKIQENPEVLNTPQAKGIAFAMGINLPRVFAPDAEEIDRTRKEIQEGLKPGETSPPIDQGPIVLGGSEPPKIETTETLPIAKGVGPIKEELPIQENDKPIIFEKRGIGDNNPPGPIPKSTERVEQGKKIIEKQMDVAVEDKKISDYFDGVDQLYDKEWYGSEKNINDFFGNQDPDDLPYSYEETVFQQYGQTRPIHEFFEDEYQGGVGDLGNADAAKVMVGGGMYKYGEFNAPEYYDEYRDKLVEYTMDKLGKELTAYRLTRKDEMDKYFSGIDTDEFGIKSFSLSKKTALSFQYLWSDYFTNRDGSPREDLVLIEAPIDVESLLMRGKSNEKEIVVDGGYLEPDKMNFYDTKGNLLKGAKRGSLKKTTKRGIGDNNPPSSIEDTETSSNLARENLNKKLLKETDADDKKAIEYLLKTDDFYAKNIKEKNEENPKLKNLPKLVEADKHFGAAANSFENFKESQLIYMSPEEYLDLTKRFRPEKQSKLSKINSDYLTDLLKEGKELANYPYLYVKKSGDSYSVNGQEGIHRAIALKNMGYKKIPVVIQGTGKDAGTGIENKVFTATPKSYLYNESWTQEHIGFVPRTIFSKGADDVFIVNPKDIREVRSKKQLFAEGGIVELLKL